MIEDLKAKTFSVLDKGTLTYIDHMGSDHDICQAARASYGKGTKSTSDDETLIRHLYRHSHSSPFEMASVKFHIRAPIMVLRQLERHRAGRMCEEQSAWSDPSVNELSARFSEAITDMMETPPDGWRRQSSANKQGSDGGVTEWPEAFHISKSDGTTFTCKKIGEDEYDPNIFGFARTGNDDRPGAYLSGREKINQHGARMIYEERLAFGVAREQARKDLPQSCYSEAVICYDLRNLLHMLGLRMESDAQIETRAYSEVLAHEIVAPLFPLTWAAFVSYRMHSLTLSSLDVEVAQLISHGTPAQEALLRIENKRERSECEVKLLKIGVLK